MSHDHLIGQGKKAQDREARETAYLMKPKKKAVAKKMAFTEFVRGSKKKMTLRERYADYQKKT